MNHQVYCFISVLEAYIPCNCTTTAILLETTSYTPVLARFISFWLSISLITVISLYIPAASIRIAATCITLWFWQVYRSLYSLTPVINEYTAHGAYTPVIMLVRQIITLLCSYTLYTAVLSLLTLYSLQNGKSLYYITISQHQHHKPYRWLNRSNEPLILPHSCILGSWLQIAAIQLYYPC